MFTRPTSNPIVPEGVKVTKIDYTNHAELVAALKGQDAIVNALGGRNVIEPTTKALFAAAVEAKVGRVFLSDWGK